MKLKVKMHMGSKGILSGESEPYIDITDAVSGIRIGEIRMDRGDFGEFVAGNGFMPGEMEIVGDIGYSNLGKKKELHQFSIPKVELDIPSYTERDAKEAIFDGQIIGYLKSNYLWPKGGGWEIWSNGLVSQQHGKNHSGSLYRYVHVPEKT